MSLNVNIYWQYKFEITITGFTNPKSSVAAGPENMGCTMLATIWILEKTDG